MKLLRDTCLCMCISLLVNFSIYSQEVISPFLTIDNGLVNNEITSIKQDKYGFLWFGTRGGLNMYNGYYLRLLRNKPSSNNNLSSQAVEVMFAGKNSLWIGTKTGGLNRYDFRTETIYNYTIPNIKEVIDVFSVYENSKGMVYIGSSVGLFVYNPKGNSFKKIDNGIVNDIKSDEKGGIWAATTSDLRRFDAKHKLTYKSSFGFKFITLTSIAVDAARNRIYLGSWNRGLIELSYETNKFKIYTHEQNNLLTNNNTHRILLGRNGMLWIGTWGGGLSKLNTASGIFSRFILSLNESTSYTNKIILSMEEDKSGVIWLGTEGGIYRIDPHKKKFNNITYQYNNPNSVLNTHIVSVLKDSQNALWVGTKDNGMQYSKDGVNFNRLNIEPLAPGNFRVNTIKQIDGKIWIGSIAGLYIFNGLNPSDRQIKAVSIVNDSTSLSGNKVTSILKDADGVIWIGTQESALNKIIGYREDGSPVFKRYLHSANPDRIQSQRITSMFNDSKGRLWVGTFNGLHLYNRKTDSFTNFKHVTSNSTSISNSIVLCINQDLKGNIWIGTPNGLNRIVEQQGRISFESYFANDNFPNDYIHAILVDKRNTLWISTNKGISTYNSSTKVFNNYDIKDGLLANAFSENAASVSKNGIFYFGSINGITYFSPDSIEKNNLVPPVYFTNLFINNKEVNVGEVVEGSVPLQKSLALSDKITLNYKQNFFTISFAALDYHDSEKNQYRYRLTGYENNWVNSGKRRSVTYTNLPPGNYTFEVRASNSDNVWNHKGANLELTILPPPWNSWWAKLFYITLFVFLLWLSRYIGLNRLRLKNKLEMANESLERQREITEIKSKLFTNISHEFRTPLTLMVGPLDDLSHTENLTFGVRKTILNVQEQAKRLLNLVNQLLDFQKAESDKLALNAKSADIVSFAKEIFYSFNNSAKRKDIKYTFNATHQQIYLNFDEEKMTIVLYNLLSNAFKFSANGGSINLNISMIEQAESPYCEIVVKDSGKGISKADQEKIFDRFYQASRAEAGKFAGTGIGLAFTKDLILLHSGDITVDSMENIGSAFTIRLPLLSTCDGGQLQNDKLNVQPVWEESEFIGTSNEAEENYLEDDERPILLIVEDNEEVNEYLTSLFDANYKTFKCFDGKKGLEKALEIIPDLVISDVMMPEMDGYEFCHELKTNINTSHIPVILLTAQSDATAQIKGINEGADVYLSKPFNSQVLKSQVKNILESRKKLKELFAKKVSLGPSEVEITSFEGEFIKKIIGKIEENISSSDFQTDDLADQMFMSRSTFYRKLKAITGMAGSEFIRHIKIQRSAQLLLSGEFTVKQVAYEVGFNDPKHFRKCFIKQYNVTPSEYAKQASQSKQE